eukprot:gene10299-8222_t
MQLIRPTAWITSRPLQRAARLTPVSIPHNRKLVVKVVARRRNSMGIKKAAIVEDGGVPPKPEDYVFVDNLRLVIQETEDFVAVVKPACMPVHTVGQYRKNTVLGILQAERPDLGVLYPTYRLDKPVSGLLLLARSSAAAAKMRIHLEGRTCKKAYVAKVQGRFPDCQTATTNYPSSAGLKPITAEETPTPPISSSEDGTVTVDVPLCWDPKPNHVYAVDAVRQPFEVAVLVQMDRPPKKGFSASPRGHQHRPPDGAVSGGFRVARRGMVQKISQAHALELEEWGLISATGGLFDNCKKDQQSPAPEFGLEKDVNHSTSKSQAKKIPNYLWWALAQQ